MNTDLNNIAHLCGTVESELKYSHDIFGESFMFSGLRLKGCPARRTFCPLRFRRGLCMKKFRRAKGCA